MDGRKDRVKIVVRGFWFRRAMSPTRLGVLVVLGVVSCPESITEVGMNIGDYG